MTTFDDSPTPQTTRCPNCPHALSVHDESGCNAGTHGGCDCPVPAPSAPARAGEPTTVQYATDWIAEKVKLAEESFAYWCEQLDKKPSDNGTVECAREAKAELDAMLYIARALAPATAEPTAEATRTKTALENWGRHFEWCAVFHPMVLDNPCNCGLQAEIDALSRGSGPVGQAKPAQWQFRFRVTSTKEWLPWVNCNREFAEEALVDSVREGAAEIRALYAAPVAASAEAKRIDAPEVRKALAGLVRMARSAAQSDRTVEFVDKSEAIITNALTAAHASPESGV